jgi:alkanesulfonate monooxygenase SsuD/methylene tetrahydromethanopterin reductase-like flavin-dependent oxidoreductase (luciferase family)
VKLPKAIERAAQGAICERAIVGTVSEVVDMIGEYRERIGLDLLIAASHFREVDEDELDASHERLALEVLPQLRQ